MNYKLKIFVGLALFVAVSLFVHQSIRWTKVYKNNGKVVVSKSESSFEPSQKLLHSKLENYNPKERTYTAKIITKRTEVIKSFPFTTVVEEVDTAYFSSPIWENL